MLLGRCGFPGIIFSPVSHWQPTEAGPEGQAGRRCHGYRGVFLGVEKEINKILIEKKHVNYENIYASGYIDAALLEAGLSILPSAFTVLMIR